MTDADPPGLSRYLPVIQPAQAVIGVDFGFDIGWRFAHPARGELQIVSSIQGCGVDHQDRHLRAAAPVVSLRVEAAAGGAVRVDPQVVEPAPLAAESVFNARKQLPLIQLSHTYRAGVIGQEDHFEIGQPLRCNPRADIALHALEKVCLDLLNDLDVIVARDRVVRLLGEEFPYLEVEMRTDNGAT